MELAQISGFLSSNPEIVLMGSLIIAVLLSMDRKNERVPFIPQLYVAGFIAITGAGYYYFASQGIGAVYDEIAKSIILSAVIALVYKYIDFGEGNIFG